LYIYILLVMDNTDIEHKKAMIPMNYYNEYNRESLYFEKLRFMGIDYEGYPLMVFQLPNGKTIVRQLFDSLRYEPYKD
jgi:hypothetical protein